MNIPEPGTYVQTMVWTGGESFSPIFGRVVRVSRKTVTVLWLHSDRTQRVKLENLHNLKPLEERVALDSLRSSR